MASHTKDCKSHNSAHTYAEAVSYVKIFLQGHLPSNWQPCTNDALVNHCGSGLWFQNTGRSRPQFQSSLALGSLIHPEFMTAHSSHGCVCLFFWHCPASPKGLPSFFRDTLGLFAFRLTHGCIPRDSMTDFGVTIPWKSFLSVVLLLSPYLWPLLSVIHFLLGCANVNGSALNGSHGLPGLTSSCLQSIGWFATLECRFFHPIPLQGLLDQLQ